MLKTLALYRRLSAENVRMALQTLVSNKLRSALSVTGISIGIFSIVMVFTLIESLEIQIKNSLATLGKSVVYIEVYPWETEDRKEYPWWRFMQRPDPRIKELQQLENSFVSGVIDALGFKMTYPSAKLVNTETGVTATEVSVEGITHSFNTIQELDILHGRYFTEQECDMGTPVAVIGNRLAARLFGKPENALGKRIRLSDKRVTITGVLKHEGESIMGNSSDEAVFVPVSFLTGFTGLATRAYNPRIIVKAKDGISIDALADELRGAMRSIRRLKPNEEDNFAINKVTFLMQYLQDFFKQINLFGLIIGGFSLLVGGFGVANIMFVSVKERTGIIGVQKALGAKRQYVLQQFLTEAIVLCILGGLAGMLFVYLTTLAGNALMSSTSDSGFRLVMTFGNIQTGLVFSLATGIVSGIVPAWFAAKLPPVEAIRANG